MGDDVKLEEINMSPVGVKEEFNVGDPNKLNFEDIATMLPSRLIYSRFNGVRFYVGKIISLHSIFKFYCMETLRKNNIMEYYINPEKCQDESSRKLFGLLENRMTHLRYSLSSIKRIGDIILDQFESTSLTYLWMQFVPCINRDDFISSDTKYKNIDALYEGYEYWYKQLREESIDFERDVKSANRILEKLLKKVCNERKEDGKENEKS